MQEQTKQSHLVRDQPQEDVNLCSRCGNLPKLFENPDGSYSLKCSCGTEAKFYMTKIDDLGIHLLRSLWNIESIRGSVSVAAQEALRVTEGDYLVYDLRDYSLLKTFSIENEAMTYMQERFDFDMEHRTTLFQLRGSELEWIMLSDELLQN